MAVSYTHLDVYKRQVRESIEPLRRCSAVLVGLSVRPVTLTVDLK